jgi:hypothetical protein
VRVNFLPPYSPDLSPIELCWSKLKEILRSAKTRTWEALDEAITMAVNLITDENALNWFNHCGLFFEPMRESYLLWRVCSQIAVNVIQLDNGKFHYSSSLKIPSGYSTDFSTTIHSKIKFC